MINMHTKFEVFSLTKFEVSTITCNEEMKGNAFVCILRVSHSNLTKQVLLAHIVAKFVEKQ